MDSAITNSAAMNIIGDVLWIYAPNSLGYLGAELPGQNVCLTLGDKVTPALSVFLVFSVVLICISFMINKLENLFGLGHLVKLF